MSVCVWITPHTWCAWKGKTVAKALVIGQSLAGTTGQIDTLVKIVAHCMNGNLIVSIILQDSQREMA